jgi:hypothetical protein
MTKAQARAYRAAFARKGKFPARPASNAGTRIMAADERAVRSAAIKRAQA